jgi:uncharacterized protein (TIGR02246 family)
MKTALLTITMALTTELNIDVQPSKKPIHAVISEQTAAWNRNDGVAWAKDFVEDATFINVRGDLVKGRPAIEKLHAFIFNGPYRESHCSVTIESIRYPAPNVAIVETVSEVTNFRGLAPGVVATEPGVLRTRPKYILIERDGTWKIFAAQNTAIAPESMPVA